MGWLRKKAKQIAGAFRKVGRKLKKGLGKIAKAFGKLGPLGSIALSFILPGMGGIAEWLGTTISKIPGGNFLVDVSTSIYNAASGAFKYVKGKISSGLGKVFNTVTGAIENGMNTVSSAFGGKGQIGSSFRNFVSDLTGGFIEKSETGLALETEQFEARLQDAIAENTGKFDGSTYAEIEKGVFEFRDKEGKIIETLKSPEYERYMELTDGDTLFDDDYGTKPTTQPKGKPSIASTIRDKDLSFKEKITTSREYAAYKPIEATRMAGAAINEGEAAMEAQVNYLKARKSDYFKSQADYQLSALEKQNYAQVMDMPTFVDYSNFNPMEDPARQYLSYRGITDYVNPLDIGGYGFDYQQFLQAQLERA